MKNLRELESVKEIRNIILDLGDFVEISINGRRVGEIDLKNPCGYDYAIATINNFVNYYNFERAVKSETSIILLMCDGDIVEFTKSSKKYLTEEEVLIEISKFSNKGEIAIKNVYYDENNMRQEKIEEHLKLDDIEKKIPSFFTRGKRKFQYKDFYVESNSICFENRQKSKCSRTPNRYNICKTIICSQKELDKLNGESKKIKIIRTNKFREHMKVHKNEFLISYESLIQYMNAKGKFNKINSDFVEMIVEFPFYVGYSEMCDIGTKKDKKIVYAKRKNRNIYSKFIMNGKRKLTNKCVVILKQSYKKSNEYYLITMFPGEQIIKEVGDKNIKTEEEKKKVLEFWDNHALVFNPKTIDLKTIISEETYRQIS